ncbi:hypothetical protein Taro_002744 [Colocasia esculenta]|uniref:Uncharacterized protein n=1 Tax=Colocasia esculenta TaxID=4460 RepID=A0A843TDJ5_COLES|nr:hypothetical protein [Colocasia esculenta]
MNVDVPYEDVVRGARSGSNSGRRLSSGGLWVLLYLLLWQQDRVLLSLIHFLPLRQNRVLLQCIYGAISRGCYQFAKRGGSFYDSTLWEEPYVQSLSNNSGCTTQGYSPPQGHLHTQPQQVFSSQPEEENNTLEPSRSSFNTKGTTPWNPQLL